MKYNASLITAALDLYFKGLSLRSITDHLNQIHALNISHLTVYRWVKKYVRLTGRFARRLKPRVSKTWHADEMKIRVNGEPRNLWNLMDHKTRYLIVAQITNRRRTREAERLLTNGLRKTALQQLDVISDGLSSYDRAIEHMRENNSLPRIRHHTDAGLSKRKSNNRLERLNGTTRERLKTMRGLDSDRSSRKFAEGYANYYNLIRPHSALGGKTPGHAAKAWKAKGTNRWISLIKDSA
jgi:transposase-like protein